MTRFRQMALCLERGLPCLVGSLPNDVSQNLMPAMRAGTPSSPGLFEAPKKKSGRPATPAPPNNPNNQLPETALKSFSQPAEKPNRIVENPNNYTNQTPRHNSCSKLF